MSPGPPSRYDATVMPDIDLTSYIRDVPDFPQPGVLFRDVTPLVHDPAAYRLRTARSCTPALPRLTAT